MVVGRYLIFSGSRAGLFVVDRATGELLEIFNPGHGVCAAPTLDAGPAPALHPLQQRLALRAST